MFFNVDGQLILPNASGGPRRRAAPSSGLAPFPMTIAQIHSGHSLTDAAMFGGAWPGHGQAVFASANIGTPNVGKSTIPGSSLEFRRNNAPGFGAPDAWGGIADWELLVATEVNNSYPEALFPGGWQASARQEQRDELVAWIDRAWTVGNGGAGATFVHYTSWISQADPNRNSPSITVNSWRERMGYEDVEHLAKVAYAEANKVAGSPTIRVIPGNALMMRLWDEAEAGNMPGAASGAAWAADATHWWDPADGADRVHPIGYGMLALAWLHLAVLHHVDPRGLPYTGFGLAAEPDATMAAWLQGVVYDLATTYPMTGYAG